MITILEDLAELKSLSALHIRDNKLEKLDGFSDKMASLQYINLRYSIHSCYWRQLVYSFLKVYIFYRGNLIADYAEVKKLHVLPKLRALVLLGKHNFMQ